MTSILFKRSSTPGTIPTVSDLVPGELAINTSDLKLYTKLLDNNVYELYPVDTEYFPDFQPGFMTQAIPGTLSSPDWLQCDGSDYLNTTYPDLSAVAFPALTVTTSTVGRVANFNKLISDGTNIIASAYANASLFYRSIASFDYNTNNWSVSNIGSTQNTVGVAFNSAISRYCLVTNVGVVYYTDSLASTWTAGGSFSWVNHNFTVGVSNGVDQGCYVSNGTTAAVLKSTTDGRFIGKLGRFPATGDWRAIAHNGTIYCAIMYNSTIAATSSDGITWTQRTLPVSANWKCISWNGNVFCAVVENSNIAATSTDGVVWTQKTLSQSLNWVSTLKTITTDNRLVFIPTGSSIGIYSTDNGDTWSDFTLPYTNCVAINYFPTSNLYGLGINQHTPNYFTSPDLITWTNRTFYNAYAVDRISYISDIDLVILPKLYGGISFDGGISFFRPGNYRTFNPSNIDLVQLTNALAGITGTTIEWHNDYIHGFSDLVTIIVNYGINNNVNCRDIMSRNSKFYTIPSGGSAMLASTDGISWNSGNLLPASGNWTPPVFNSSGLGVCLCANTAIGVMTTDGEDWSAIALPVSANWQSVGCTDSFFYAFSYGSNIVIYSFNAIDWFQYSLPAVVNWKAPGNFTNFAVAFGYGALTTLYSTTAYAWNYYTDKSVAANWNVGITVNESIYILKYGQAGYAVFSQSVTQFTTPYVPENYTGFIDTSGAYAFYVKT